MAAEPGTHEADAEAAAYEAAEFDGAEFDSAEFDSAEFDGAVVEGAGDGAADVRAEAYQGEAAAFAAAEFDPSYPAESSEAESYETELGEAGTFAADAALDEDPPDEPPAQLVSPSVQARVAMLASEVLVVDGRPRYHIGACTHLFGRETEPLPVGEAVELGFTPCSLCEPDSALLAEAQQI